MDPVEMLRPLLLVLESFISMLRSIVLCEVCSRELFLDRFDIVRIFFMTQRKSSHDDLVGMGTQMA